MVSNLANVLETAAANVSVKATTTEKLGFVGEEKGIAAYAVALIYKT
jgi:2-C-methyl-D-erythritol 2,4-cyclodiphosphate synthase